MIPAGTKVRVVTGRDGGHYMAVGSVATATDATGFLCGVLRLFDGVDDDGVAIQQVLEASDYEVIE